MSISSDASVTPRDYSESSSAGVNYRNYDALLNPSPAELMDTDCGLVATADAPVLADVAYGTDALPILYYRMDVKYNAEVPVATNVPVAAKGSGTPSGSFYLASNDYLATRTKGSKAFLNSSIGNLSAASNAMNLQNLVFQTVGGHPVPRGSFVLISAGADRTYGADPKGNVDDIIVAGGN
jgi:hypothetical protein